MLLGRRLGRAGGDLHVDFPQPVLDLAELVFDATDITTNLVRVPYRATGRGKRALGGLLSGGGRFEFRVQNSLSRKECARGGRFRVALPRHEDRLFLYERARNAFH